MSAPRVHHLAHARRPSHFVVCVKTIGFYRTSADAAQARTRAVMLPGFADTPSDFLVMTYDLGDDRWVGGFTGWSPGFKLGPAHPLDAAAVGLLDLDRVFVLYHAREFADVRLEDDARLVGVYASHADALEGKARARRRAGFRAAPHAFVIDETKVGADHWTSGYVTECVCG